MKAIIIITLIQLCHFISQAQTQGCTDPQALNYNNSATVNDGTCIYPPTQYTPTLKYNLDTTLAEISGMIIDNGYIWAHNDGGNATKLYKLDSATGSIIKSVTIRNAPQIDWEALTQDEQYVYIGDFGNNGGDRRNLKILKIAKSSLNNADTVDAHIITFNYADQNDFTTQIHDTKYDAEAIICKGDSLYIFTKDWKSLSTSVYALHKHNVQQTAQRIDSFFVNGLITDATYVPATNTIALLGYQKADFGMYFAFVWLLHDFTDNHFFSGNKRRIELGTVIDVGQAEGITLQNDLTGYISGEAITLPNYNINEPAKAHAVDFRSYFSMQHTHIKTTLLNKNLRIYPNPTQNFLLLSETINQPISYQILNINGKVINTGTIHPNTTKIAINSLPIGHYKLILANEKQVSFIKD